jgi:mono/diheme cytochrome c family protein
MRAICVLIGLAAISFALTPAMADEDTIVLKEGIGKDVVEANCAACHSLDYVQMNSPFLDQKKWEATVKKMIERFGAPIEPNDASQIISYLAQQYGS